MKHQMKRSVPAFIGMYAILITGAVIMLVPFLWMVLTSFKTYVLILIPLKAFSSRTAICSNRLFELSSSFSYKILLVLWYQIWLTNRSGINTSAINTTRILTNRE